LKETYGFDFNEQTILKYNDIFTLKSLDNTLVYHLCQFASIERTEEIRQKREIPETIRHFPNTPENIEFSKTVKPAKEKGNGLPSVDDLLANQCPRCGQVFPNKLELIDHLNTCNGGEKVDG